MQSKIELRKFAKDFRKTLNINEVSEEILQIFLNTDIYKNAKNIGLYYPFGNELNIKPLLNDKSKKFFLPKINTDDEMFFAPFNSENDLVQGKYGIFEPENNEKINPKILNIIIVPALMVDKLGYRLGYGKGYYDKFFANNNFSGEKIVFIPEKLLIDNLPINKYDVQMDIIITENDIYYIK